jgi:hypothetical protein
LAFFVSDLIEQLDLSAITTVYEQNERGYPPYHPVMMTKLPVSVLALPLPGPGRDWADQARAWMPVLSATVPRGLTTLQAEWSLVCTAHNISKPYGSADRRVADPGP